MSDAVPATKRQILDALSVLAIAISIGVGLYLASWLWGIFSFLILFIASGLGFAAYEELRTHEDSPRSRAHRANRKRAWTAIGIGGVMLAAVFWWLWGVIGRM